jgi:hypothetical protein
MSIRRMIDKEMSLEEIAEKLNAKGYGHRTGVRNGRQRVCERHTFHSSSRLQGYLFVGNQPAAHLKEPALHVIRFAA